MAARSDLDVIEVANPPKLIQELHEILGELHGFGQASAKMLAVQIGSRNLFLPLTFQAQLEELKGQRIAVTLIEGKYYLRILKGAPGGV